jgi:biopolymer transport protein ExbD
MRIPSPRAKKRERIEIIPLIDIMFFLLATFVMVSLSMVKNKGIPVNLPVASTSEAVDREDYASITVTEDGNYFYNKEKLPLADLTQEIIKLKASFSDPKVFINGDEKADFGAAIAVLDEVRRAGISKIAIETKQLEKK